MVSALLAAAALLGPSSSVCPASLVRYQSAKHPTLGEQPWVLALPQDPGVAVFLPDYPRTLRYGPANRSDGLVLWSQGARIVWNRSGTVLAQRLDGRGTASIGAVAVPYGMRSDLRFSSVGCWRLTLRAPGVKVSIVARVIAQPKRLGCGATKLEERYAYARPRSSGIRGGWGGWATPEGGALLFTHGHAGRMNMKVLWSVRRNWGRSLELAGTRLDEAGSFRQEFPMTSSPVGFFPSTVDVPAAGCWLFRLRTGRLAGVLVVRAVDYQG
jgi:hypothetical protein